MKTSLIGLLSQLMFGKITPEQFKELGSILNNSSDKELESTMQALWEDPLTSLSVPEEDNQRIVAVLERHIHTKSYNLRWLKIAAIIILPLLLTWGPYLYFSSEKMSVPDMIVMAESGQKTHLILPDGSKVWLNSGSSLSYPSDFGTKTRTVRLTGEGYFEVMKDDIKIFSVETEGVNIQVHGTKFNITAHPNAPKTDISLIEGSISVEDKAQNRLAMLMPNQTFKINNENLQFEIIEEDTQLAALWSENKCRVENATAEEVFKKIGYWYGLNIHLENNNTDYRYGFTIKEESFREFLELINELTPLEYSINGEEVTIRYK